MHHDHWIPRVGSMVPLGAMHVPNIIKVADLLNSQGTRWDNAKLQQVFSEDDANDIQQITVGGPGRADFRAWNYTKDGKFTVQSAYHLGVSIRNASKTLAQCSNPVANHKSWVELWSTDVPNKIKIHAWRLIRNGLAVGMELHRRRIKPGIFCIACGREEDLLHRFWRCPHTKEFWKLLSEAVAAPLPWYTCTHSVG